MLASSGGTILPPGYAQIPYIECNGDSYIDTGIVYSSANSYNIDTNMLQDASMLVGADGNLSLNLNDISSGSIINIKQVMAAKLRNNTPPTLRSKKGIWLYLQNSCTPLLQNRKKLSVLLITVPE